MAQINVTQVLGPVSEIVRQCPTTTLIQAYIAAVREFCNKTRILKTSITGVTVADTAQYNLGDDASNEVIGIRAMSIQGDGTNWTPVTDRSQTLWDANASTDEPEFYNYLPHAAFLLGPTPNAVYNLDVTAVLQPKLGVVSFEESLLVDWSEAFKAGALHRLLRIKGEPWSDPGESNAQLILFTAQLNYGKSAEAAGHNAGSAATERNGGPNARLRGRIGPI